MRSLDNALELLPQDNLRARLESIGSLGESSRHIAIIRAFRLGRSIPSIGGLIVLILVDRVPGGTVVFPSTSDGLAEQDHCVSHQSPLDEALSAGGCQHSPFHDLIQGQQQFGAAMTHWISHRHSNDGGTAQRQWPIVHRQSFGP